MNPRHVKKSKELDDSKAPKTIAALANEGLFSYPYAGRYLCGDQKLIKPVHSDTGGADKAVRPKGCRMAPDTRKGDRYNFFDAAKY